MFSHIKELFTRPSGYRISRSVRLRSSASAYFNRSVATTSATHLWAYSGWLKRGTFGADVILFGAGSSSTEYTAFYFDSSNRFNFVSIVGGVIQSQLISTPVYRDPSHYYHIAFFYESGNATSTNRLRLYVNGVQVTAFTTATYPTLNLGTYINNSVTGGNHVIGKSPFSAASYFDGYLTEINFIDGQALTPSSFGENDAVTGVWKPKKYAGTYGTNGFYLNFSDNSAATAAAIGKDYSGNSNNWTPNNISVTAGATYDSMLDVPTNYADGGNGRGNYAVMNPLNQLGNATPTNGNLTVSQAVNQAQVASSIGMSSGKWYYEHTITAVGGENSVGIGTALTTGIVGGATAQWGYYSNGQKYTNSSGTAYGASFTTGDVIGVAYDADAGSLTFYKNGTSQGVAFTSLSGTMFALAATRTTGGQNTSDLNFGQRPFSYTPPTGFVALNTQNLPTPTISNGATVMAATLYTGTSASGNTQTLTFSPDFVWLKNRTTAASHNLMNTVVGNNLSLQSNTTGADNTIGFTFGTNSFTINATGAETNASGNNYVAWSWNAGGSTVTNTSGTISAQVRANPTAGFSVVTYTGTAANATVGHGLGVAPSMIITKNRDSSTAWWVYHTSLGNTKYLVLNTTAAAVTSSSAWNNTSPTSSVFSIGSANPSNANQDVAYCFAAVSGYSAFGSYTGNGSTDGPFVYTGFRPRYVMWKRTDAINDWYIIDTSRSPYNEAINPLAANLSSAESSLGTNIDFISNGFKPRQTGAHINASGGTYIYAAFAESPFKLALAR